MAPTRRPGPEPLITDALLLEAGAAVARRNAREQRARLGDVLNVRLADVLEESSALLSGQRGRRSRVSPPVLYRRWPGGFNEYLTSLVRHLFNPGKLDMKPLSSSGRPWAERLRRYVDNDQNQMAQDADLWFGIFGGASIPEVRESLRSVYDEYDRQVAPALEEFLASSGLELRVSVGDLARMLTALTEGFGLRQTVDPVSPDRSPSLWSEAAIALVHGLRRDPPGAVED